MAEVTKKTKFSFRLLGGKHYEGRTCPHCTGTKLQISKDCASCRGTGKVSGVNCPDCQCKTCEGSGKVVREYSRGDIIKTDRNLMAMFNVGAAMKFERADDGVQTDRHPSETARQYAERLEALAKEAREAADAEDTTSNERATFVGMTVEQLRAHAQEEEIDLGKARTKDEIIDAILSVTAGA